QEEVGLLWPVQYDAGAPRWIVADHGATQRWCEAVENRRREHTGLHGLRLAGEHPFEKKLEQITIAVAMERGNDVGRLGMIPKRDTDQAQPKGPPFGMRERGRCHRWVERPPGRQLQERCGLRQREIKVNGPDID